MTAGRWFSRVVWLGIVCNMALAVPALLAPEQTMTIRADPVDVFDQPHTRGFGCADPLAEAMIAVARHAELAVERGPARRQRRIDRVRVFRRRQRPDPVAHALDRVVIDGYRCHARAERRAQVALVY
jgi:hypothetical protein